MVELVVGLSTSSGILDTVGMSVGLVMRTASEDHLEILVG